MQGKRWNPEHYFKYSAIQLGHAKDLIDKHPFSGEEKILDIGCGDGKMTMKLSQFFLINGHSYMSRGVDNAFSADRYKKNTSGFFIPSEIPNDRSGYLYEKISSEFGIENTTGFIRNFQGYQLIIIFSQNRSNGKPAAYPQRERHLCNYAIDFFEKLLLFYAHDKPQLKYSRFCKDAFFRNKLICGEFNDDAAIAFKERELQCLYWAQMGKTAEEIAIILDLKKSTVRGYLEDIREKCGVSCIQEAIVLATQQKLISCG